METATMPNGLAALADYLKAHLGEAVLDWSVRNTELSVNVPVAKIVDVLIFLRDDPR